MNLQDGFTKELKKRNIMKYDFSSMQIELILTAVGEKEFSCPKNHPARQNYADLRKYIRECQRA